MKSFILFIYQLLFDRWEIEIIEEGNESWYRSRNDYPGDDYVYRYIKNYVKYKYKHKFFKKEKIVKTYLN